MLSDVEEKTFEFGMLRALGFNTKNIVTTITIQAFTFSVPGLLCGLIMAALLNIILRHILYSLTNNSASYMLSMGALYIGCIIGIFMPLASYLFPIQNALSKNLRGSLDLYHRSANELTISIKKLKDFGLSIPQLVMAIMLVVMGIFTYYVAPTAFLFGKFELFYVILNCVLLMMILGLTFISILILPSLQKLILNVFLLCFYKDRKLKKIIEKNMVSHGQRNTKTAIMFAICLSFLIFSGSTFKLIGTLI